MKLQVGKNAEDVGRLAAVHAAGALRAAVEKQGAARVLFASAPSQQYLLDHLVAESLPWAQIHAFHIDEYVGIDAALPQGFGNWLNARLFHRVPLIAELIDPAADPEAEASRYGSLLRDAPIDLALLGIGVNGHVAFNEPYQWLIDDPRPLRHVLLDEESRRQQVDDGCFDTLEEVPASALTVTMPLLLSASTIIVSVVGAQKARGVADTLTPGVRPSVPASALQTHPDVTMYVDPPALGEAAGKGGAR